MANSLLCALLLGLVATAAAAEPAPISIPGEERHALGRIDTAALRGFEQDQITHITFHHEGFAGADAALFSRASKARRGQSASQRVQNINAYHAGDARLGMIAYHYAIGSGGEIVKGRPVNLKPATKSTALGTSKLADFDGHFAVMALGDFTHERLTGPARLSLVRVMSDAQRLYRVPTVRIQPHKDHAQTACPGTHILAEAGALAQMTLIHSLQAELAQRGCGVLDLDGQLGADSLAAFARFRQSAGSGFKAALPDDAALMEMLSKPGLTCR